MSVIISLKEKIVSKPNPAYLEKKNTAQEGNIDRRTVITLSAKTLGALYLTPATVSLLTAKRATAQSTTPPQPCHCTPTTYDNTAGAVGFVIRYTDCQGNNTRTYAIAAGEIHTIDQYYPSDSYIYDATNTNLLGTVHTAPCDNPFAPPVIIYLPL
jgi:hypothetical protein